jgi:hypothetical protein
MRRKHHVRAVLNGRQTGFGDSTEANNTKNAPEHRILQRSHYRDNDQKFDEGEAASLHLDRLSCPDMILQVCDHITIVEDA